LTREIKGHDIFYYLQKLADELNDHPDTQIQVYSGITLEQIIKEFQAVPETKTKAVFDFPEELMIQYFSEWEGWECLICGEDAGDHKDMYRHLATHTKEELENLTTVNGDNAENDEDIAIIVENVKKALAKVEKADKELFGDIKK